MALVRRHIGIAAPVDRELREELLNCRQALQRIGRNVDQIARAANKMALADNAAEIAGELQKVNDLRAAIGAAVGIGAATKADLSYWRFPVSDFDSSFEAGQLAALFKPKLTSDPNRRGADMLLRSLSSRRAGQGGSTRARLARVVSRAPEVMVKVTGRPRAKNHNCAFRLYRPERRCAA
jgi:hypothetical protein